MMNYQNIISEIVESYLQNNLLDEGGSKKKNKNTKGKSNKEKDRKDNRFKKKAIKGKGGIRRDFDVEDDKIYNKNVDDQEQESIENALSNGFVNIKKVAEKLYPDHTPEGAQSQLNKKLKHAKSDSGSTYKLKTKEVRRLRHIIAQFLHN